MQKIKQFTIKHPIAFGLILILLFSLLSTLTWPITQIAPQPEGYEVGVAVAKLVIATCFLLLLRGLGWLKDAGFTSLGGQRSWIFVIVWMIYAAIYGGYAFIGSLQFSLPSMELILPILLYTFATSLVEETMYRGLLLTVMVKAWGNTRRGIVIAAILSGFFWASTHLFNLLVRPFPVVALQVVGMMMVSLGYAAIVLYSHSIWPAILLHWVINASVGFQIVQIANFTESMGNWVIYVLFALPVAAVGGYLLQRVALKTEPIEGLIADDQSLETMLSS